MKESIFLIVKEGFEPKSHGEPGEPSLILATDGAWYDLGGPLPWFRSEVVAERYRKEFDKYNFYHIIEVYEHD